MKNRRVRRGAIALSLAIIVNVAGGLVLPAKAAALGQPAGPGDIPVEGGEWGPVEDWPLVAIHAALDSRGRVVTYGTNGDGQQTGQFIYDVWTPNVSAAAGHATLANTTNTDLFCSLQLNRPDTGEMLLFGGDNWDGAKTNNLGNADINSFNPDTNQLTNLPGMQLPRWYGTGTVRPDGSLYVQGGAGGGAQPELWTAEGGSQLLDLDTSGIAWWYPRNFLTPDGRIFGVDIEGRMYFISADLSELTMVGRLGEDRWGYGTTAVMFEQGRILHFGGETDTAVIIDVNGPTPIVTPVAGPSAPREWVNATLLPDGRVLATGGASFYTAGQLDGRPLADYNITNAAEIWDPATGQWTYESAGVAARLYHSTALLLPDGRVLVAGGGSPGPVTNTNAEIFSPNYLRASNGAPTIRPIITAVSSTDLTPGEVVAIDIDSNVDIGKITLLKTGSVTHSVNMDQRIVDLPFTVANETLFASLPTNGADLTPGYYMLSALTTEGVPSVSIMVKVGIAPLTPATLTGVEAQVARLYMAYFLRLPDQAGLQYWLGQLRTGQVTLAEVSDAFAGGAEFNQSYGALTNEQFVDQVYRNVVGREADAEGRTYWIAQLAAGMTRGELMLAFSESAEFITLTQNGVPPVPAAPADPVPPVDPPAADPADPAQAPAGEVAAEVRRLYLAYFLRDPDQAGWQYWVDERNGGATLISVADAFAQSAEFTATYGAATDAQFVDLVYANVLERPADAEGHAYWLGQLQAGVSRGEIMTGFSNSAEFIVKVG